MTTRATADMMVVKCADEKFRVHLCFDTGEVFCSEQTFDNQEDAFDAMCEWHRVHNVQVVLLQ